MKFLLETYWIGIKDGDSRAVGLFKRHYSARKGADNIRYGFSGKGESMVLMTVTCDALFCWRKVVGEGIVCSVFRNEGDILSSTLIKEAVALAKQRWGNERFYTYINAAKIKSTNPGFCFLKAGWQKCGRTKGGLDILELNNRGACP